MVDQLGESLMRNRHFEEHVVLFKTASKQLIQIARGLGKQEFKAHLEPVFDILFYATRSDVILTKAAAEECLAELAKFLGERNYKTHCLILTIYRRINSTWSS